MASTNFVKQTPPTQLGRPLALVIVAMCALGPNLGCADPLVIPESCVDRDDPEFPTYTCYKVFRHFREILDLENSDTIADLNLGQLRKLLGAEPFQPGSESGLAQDEIRRLRSQIDDQAAKIQRLEALLGAALTQGER
jgi:hypothetical protein